jgi:hypothetical protein
MLEGLLASLSPTTVGDEYTMVLTRPIDADVPPLLLGHTCSEVIKRADAVWDDFLKGKLEHRHNRRARATITGDELDSIIRGGGTDAAIVLLLKLRIEHGGRTRRGEDFAIACHAMDRCDTIPGWGRKKYQAARDQLL